MDIQNNIMDFGWIARTKRIFYRKTTCSAYSQKSKSIQAIPPLLQSKNGVSLTNLSIEKN